MSTRKVLIVDDNPNMSVLLSDILEIFEYKGYHCEDGSDALERLRKDKFDLVFTDLRMPRMDGYDLLHAIKNEHPDIPVVVVTGYSVEEGQDVILSKKADGFLHKPFKVNEIEAILNKLLNQSK